MGLWRDKTRGDWRYSFEFQKKPYAGGGFETKGEARTAREERRNAVKNPQPKPQTPIDMGFLDLSNKYLDWSERRHAQGNVANKKVVFSKLASYLGITEKEDFPIRKVTPSTIEIFLSKSTPSANSYNNYRKELSTLFSWIQKIHIPDLANPCAVIEKIPRETPEKKIPSKQEFLKILASCKPDDRPLIVILIHTLARIDEILRLTWQDVNFDKGTVILWARKNKAGEWKPRTISMNSDLKPMLKSMWKRRKQEKWVFYNVRSGNRYLRRPKLMRSLCKRAKIEGYGFHALRHFTATYLHDVKKVPTGVLSGILGHSNKRTTEIYLHTVDEAAREALTRLEGIFETQAMLAVLGKNDGE